MAFQKISNYGVEELPGEYLCASTDTKVTEGIVTGSTLWEYDTQIGYVFADGDWRVV